MLEIPNWFLQMSIASKDPFDRFADDYEQGNFLKALQHLIISSQLTYDDLNSIQTKGFPLLINYADASVFKGPLEFRQTQQLFVAFLDQEPRLKILLDSLIEQLHQEFNLFWAHFIDLEELDKFKGISQDERTFFTLFKQGKIGELEPLFASLPLLYQPLFRQKAQLVQQWQNFQMAKPGLSRLIGGNDWALHCPWQPFAYHQDLKVKDLNPQGEIPLIFLEPLDSFDYVSFLAPYNQGKCLFVVETIAHFFQLLQFPELSKILACPQHGLYILELYPQTQFEQQNLLGNIAKTFRPVLMTERCDFERAMPLLEQVLGQCLAQPESEWRKDTPVANWQYALAKKLLFTREAERYGKNRFIALNIEKGLQNWHDPHKGLPPLEADLGSPTPNYLQGILEETSKTRHPRSFSPKHRIRLAHVVPQIVDGGHAPTRLLQNLCIFADTKWFEVFVLSTERLSEHILEYPIAHYSSLSSNERGKSTIEVFNRLGISVWVDSDSSHLSGSSSSGERNTAGN